MADNKTQIIITARDETRAAFQSVQASLGNLEKSAIGLGPIFAGLGAALTFGAFANTINNTLKFAAALDDMSEATGASVENLSALSGVAKIGGHDLGMVETSLQKLAKALHGTGEETKGASAALEAIGLSAAELRGMDTAEALLAVSKALDQFQDGSGKAAVAIALLGKSGANALPFLKDLAEQSELVGKVTTEQAALAEAYEKSLNKLSASFGAAGKAAAYELLPFLEKLTSELVKARDESGSFASVFGDGVRVAMETVAVIGVNVVYVFKQIGNEIGGIAAQIAALGRFDFKGFSAINEMMKEDAAAARIEVDRLSASLLNTGKEPKAKPDEKPKLGFKAPEETVKVTKAAGSRAQKEDDYTKLIKSLQEKIAVEQINIETVGKATQAEKDYAKYQADVASGAVKLTAEQQRVVGAYYETYIARQQDAKAAAELNKAIEDQTEAMRRYGQSLDDELAKLQKETELYGLSERAVASRTVALLEDAIATARANGAYEDQVAYLERELELRKAIADQTDRKEVASILAQTPSAKEAQTASKKAALDRALANKEITAAQYDEAIKVVEEKLDQMSEFAIQAARNMQDAFADFLFDPFANGVKGMVRAFADAVRRMVAEALSAQLLNALFGDMGKTGKIGGLVGSFFGVASGAASGGSTAGFIPYAWANGGIMTSDGPLPLNRYAGGGVADRPQLAMFGEGRMPEAYVPLPDGRNIPVRMHGQAQAPAQNIRIVNAFDVSVVGDYLGSAAGERLIINAVQRNSRSVRQAIA